MHGDYGLHFLGWHLYRHGPWTLPVGATPLLIAPIGSSIGLTDSIPIVGIPLKVLAPLLPPVFQFIGLWLVLSVALFFVWMIAVAFLYLVLGGMGVWSKLNSNVGDLLNSASGTTGGELVSSGTIFGSAALIGLVNIVLLTAMATCAAFIYNLTTDLVGGVEVTLADRD